MIVTHCIEYARSGRSKCETCSKHIIPKQLRFGQLTRQSKKEKKSHAQYTWFHFACFRAPSTLVYRPLVYLRGYEQLKDKDQKRVRDLFKLGPGVNVGEAKAVGLVGEQRTASLHVKFDDSDGEEQAGKAIQGKSVKGKTKISEQVKNVGKNIDKIIGKNVGKDIGKNMGKGKASLDGKSKTTANSKKDKKTTGKKPSAPGQTQQKAKLKPTLQRSASAEHAKNKLLFKKLQTMLK